jgi:uncharacterized protein (TIGR02145 family)
VCLAISISNLGIPLIRPGASGLQDKDGNYYNTVVINGQEWIIENLKTLTYGNGTPIPNITGGDEWLADTDGAYCHYLNDPVYKDRGVLYNWYAGTNVNWLAYFTRGGVQEVGWRVPSMTDWTLLMIYIGGIDYGYLLKDTNPLYWTPPIMATNELGFNGYGVGNRYIDTMDGFASINIFADWWSTDDGDEDSDGSSVYLHNDDPLFMNLSAPKFCGQNVRCVRDL